jgi:hypothetical protein
MKFRVALAIMFSTPLLAQVSPSTKQVDAAMGAYDKGRYFEATDKLSAAAFDKDGKATDDYAFQMWEQVSSTVTNELDLATLDKARPPGVADSSWDKAITGAASRDAIAEIVRRAGDTGIVILNEAHSSPRDRAFAWRVAQALRPLGYSVLAAETFDNEPSYGGKPTVVERLARDRLVRTSTGFYTRDPVYAAFLRNALAIGYQPVSYDQNSQQRPKGDLGRRQSIEAREQAEADNLVAIHRRLPTAKLLIYVGYSHVAEAALNEGDGGKIEWMAARLKRMTGIDPLTIDQTTVTEFPAATRKSYYLAAARVNDQDGILFEGDKPLVLGQYAGAVDLQVVHPRREYRYGRPAWLADLGGKPLPVPMQLLPNAGRRLVQVFPATAPLDAIPFDQVVVEAGSPPAMLIAPQEPVRFATQP